MRFTRVLVVGCAVVALLGACGDDDDDSGTDDADTSETDAGSEVDDTAITLSVEDFSGATEVPGPGDPDASGTVERLEIVGDELCVTFAVADLDDPATAAHLHAGEAGVAGDPVVNFGAPADAAAGSWDTCAAIDSTVANDVETNPTGYYLNVHTATYQAGAARAQLTG